MADQEFLASFGVEIDESGVTRLQNILEENRKLADSVAKAFSEASRAMLEYRKEAAGSSGASSPDPAEGIRGLAQLSLSGYLTDPDSPVMPRNAREWALQNLETMSVGMATKDSKNASASLIGWQEAGLKSDPSSIPGYRELEQTAGDYLREPIAKAREYMQQAMDAEAQGLDGTGYVEKMEEILREPFERVREMYEEFDFGDLGGDGGSDSGNLLNELEEANEGLDDLREAAETPIILKANASGAVSAARTALENIRSIFANNTVTIYAQMQNLDTAGSYSTGAKGGTARQRMSTGGRFVRPTDVQVAEDGGTEYIIPVGKESRAVPLLRQLLGELSPAARESLLGGGGAPLVGGMAAGTAPAAGITQNNQTVSAPVSINVRASGSDGKEIGESIYNTAERYLLRTLRSAFS